MTDPTAPHPAAAVGVARPPKIEPRTVAISNAGGIRAVAVIVSFRMKGGSFSSAVTRGPSSGRIMQRQMI